MCCNCSLLFVVCCVWSVVIERRCCLLFIGCPCLLFVACCLLCVVCWLLFVDFVCD